MEMDMTGLWSWTVPLWGLGALVFFLATILMSPADILTRPAGTIIASGNQGGGSMLTTGHGGGSRARKSSNH